MATRDEGVILSPDRSHPLPIRPVDPRRRDRRPLTEVLAKRTMGEDDPGGQSMTAPQSSTPDAPGNQVGVRHRAPVGAIVLVVLGALIALAGLAVTAGGGSLLWLHGTQRDADGFYTTDAERFETTTHAITSEKIDLGRSDPGSPVDLGDLGTVRVSAEDTDGTEGGRVFVGIARQSDVDRYLAGVSHAQVRDIWVAPFSVSYRFEPGDRRPAPPGSVDIWAASATGTGQQSIDWSPRSGTWALVVMNADGSPGVSVTASAGVEVPWLLGAAIGLLIGGLAVMALGAVLLVIGVVGLARDQQIELGGPEPVAGQPVRLEGRLDRPGRWLWLVKWLLLIPHFIVLAVLWIAFSVVTFIAFFAILFTAHYPRALFEFNVGVLRWTWRVTYYGYSALGTDRYPPFTLGHAPDYPATFEVAYPERLSRGLVLVKWWLLAIPQYLVLGILLGGASGAVDQRAAGIGLIGLLVLFAALALLFTGGYPAGLYDFVMGLNRWAYRVIVYVALMRDEYPPFRLDQGGSEPSRPTPPAPAGPTDGAAAVVLDAPRSPEAPVPVDVS
jgi:hypothetical protein